MRLLLIAAVLLTAAGCSIRAEALPASTQPVYDQPQAIVFAACLRACEAYCHDHPQVADEASGSIQILDRNGWTGATTLDVQLVAIDAGHTRLDMTATRGRASNGDILNRRRMAGFMDQVGAEVQALALVRASLAADQTAAVAGSGSGTSRP